MNQRRVAVQVELDLSSVKDSDLLQEVRKRGLLVYLTPKDIHEWLREQGYPRSFVWEFTYLSDEPVPDQRMLDEWLAAVGATGQQPQG